MPGDAPLREQMMLEAATAYATLAHGDQLPAVAKNEALRAAAMCYLQIGQLDAAGLCVDAARGEPLELSEAS